MLTWREPNTKWDYQPPITLPPEGARPPPPCCYTYTIPCGLPRVLPPLAPTSRRNTLTRGADPSRLGVHAEATSSASPPHIYWKGTAQSTLPFSPTPAQAPLRRSPSGPFPLGIARASLAADLQKYITLNLGVRLFMVNSYTYRNTQENPILHYTTFTP